MVKTKKKIRFDTEVPDAECLACPFSCCAHPLQEIFSGFYDPNVTSYAKLCIKDLMPCDRKKVLARIFNQGCVHALPKKKQESPVKLPIQTQNAERYIEKNGTPPNSETE